MPYTSAPRGREGHVPEELLLVFTCRRKYSLADLTGTVYFYGTICLAKPNLQSCRCCSDSCYPCRVHVVAIASENV